MTGGWRSTTIQEFVDRGEAELKTGPFGTQLHASDYVEHGTPVINVRNIGFGTIVPEKLEYISDETVGRLASHLLQADDIVFGRKGAVERHAFMKSRHDKWFQGSDCLRLRVNGPNLVPRFLSYCFLTDDHKQWMMNQCSHGATMASLNQAVICRIAFRLPPPPIQQGIASILSIYDDLIENNTRRIKMLEDMAQMLYREWFVNFRFPGHQKVKMVDSELGPIPVAWTVEPLEAVCKRVTDGSHWSPQTVESVHLMASSKDMHRWGLTLSTCRKIAKEVFDTLVRNDCKPLAGDVLITKDGANYLKFCFTVENDMDVVLLSSVAIIRPNPIRASSHFLAFYLSDESVKTRLAGRVSGAAIPRIVLKDFRYFKVVVPPMAIQNHFVQIVEPMVALCWRLINKNTNLRSTRDFLLPKLISGEVPVQAAAEAMEQTA